MVNEVVTDEIEEEELELDQNLVFTVKSQEFGIQAVRVQETSRVLPTTKVPNAPSYIEGIMNLRGRLASVINFRKRLGFEPKEHDEDTRVIVVELDTFPIGIIVDSVEEVIKIPDEKVQKLPESTTTSALKDYMTGVGMLDNRLVILLDVDKVLTSAELIELGEINQMTEKSEGALEPVETNQKTDRAEDAPEAAETDQIEDEAKEAPEPVESEKRDAEQPAAKANRRTRRRTR
jgi:purine-binding chemotaxis protein CheW